MGIMKYDAMNLGEYDLKLGADYLTQSAKRISFPYLSSNIDHDNTIPINPYTIKQIGDKSIAILGIVSPTALNNLPEESTDGILEIIQPRAALQSLLPEISSKADYIILISRLPFAETEALVADFKEIDLILMPKVLQTTDTHDNAAVSDAADDNSKIVACSAAKNIKPLEILSVILEDEGIISIIDKEELDLNDSVPHDEQIDKLIMDSYYGKIKKIQLERLSKKLIEHHSHLKEGLNKTPEQFIQELKSVEQQSELFQTPAKENNEY